jgi:hypothetical protein
MIATTVMWFENVRCSRFEPFMFLSSLTPYVRLRIAPYGEGELLTTASDELSAKRPILGGRLRVRSGHKGQ